MTNDEIIERLKVCEASEPFRETGCVSLKIVNHDVRFFEAARDPTHGYAAVLRELREAKLIENDRDSLLQQREWNERDIEELKSELQAARDRIAELESQLAFANENGRMLAEQNAERREQVDVLRIVEWTWVGYKC